MINFILVAFIVVSLVFYLYLKVKQFRSEYPIAKKWHANRAHVALGSLLFFFGLNQIFIFPSTLTYIVSGLFILLGLLSMVHSYKAAKHYGQFVKEELRLNQK